MKLAAIQFMPSLKDPANNLRVASGLVQQAITAGAKVITLPELCTTGYSFMSREDAMPYAEELRGSAPTPSMRLFGGLAREFGVAIAWGVMEKTPGLQLHNSQVLFTPSTFVVCQKLNHWGNDFLWADGGEESPPILEFKGKRIGTLICRDIRDKGPKGSRLTDFYEKGDADIVCFSANFGDGGFPSISWVQFARDNQTWLIVSNRYGREENNDFGEGGVCVIEPSGKVHCEGLRWSQPCIVYADIK
jgi:predicted amidohydrolase